jgi:hypothetical protein
MGLSELPPDHPLFVLLLPDGGLLGTLGGLLAKA